VNPEAEALGFLEALFTPEPPGLIAITRKPAWGNPATFTNAAAVGYIIANPLDCYVRIGLIESKPPGRGTEEHTIAIPGVYVDIDVIGGPNNAGGVVKNGAPTLEAALALAHAVLEPTVTVRSGHGLQVFWLFEQPLTLADDQERASAKQLTQGWHARLQREASAHGVTSLDSCYSIDHLFRVPGTTNAKDKDEPVPVQLLDDGGPRYSIEQIREQIRPLEEWSTNGDRREHDQGSPSSERSDHAVLERAFADRNRGARIRSLYNGSSLDKPSRSEAAAALTWELAYFTQNPYQLARLLRGSRNERLRRPDEIERIIKKYAYERWANGEAYQWSDDVEPDEPNAEAGGSWLTGAPMDPAAEKPEPLPTLPGLPFLHAGASAMIVGPTGGGRSSLIEACLYDAARAGLPCLYLGHEVTESEFNARAASLAEIRGDALTDQLRAELARARYLDLTTTAARAWDEPTTWAEGVAQLYRVVVFDPLSAVESAVGLNFEQRNTEYIRFFDRIVQPVTARGVSVVLIDNVGHAEEAKNRAKGASAKSDRADLTFSCALVSDGLLVKAHKIRSVRAAFSRGQTWLFVKATQMIETQAADAGGFRPTKLMQKASIYIEMNPSEGIRAIRCGVGGKLDYVDKAVKCLVEEGFVEVRSYGQKRAHYSLKPFRELGETEPRTIAF